MANYDLTYEGPVVQRILDTGKSLEDDGYIFLGTATPSTNPGTPIERVAYVGGPGTYNNFGTTVVVPSGSIVVITYSGNAWSKTVINPSADGYVYSGIATADTNPGTPTGKVFYIATAAGTYTNFGGLVLTQGINILKYNGTAWVKEQVLFTDGGVFDISAYHATGGTLATYTDLVAALSGGANIPQSLQKGGMSVKFVQSSDNKYVQYFLTKNVWSASESDWEKLNLEEEVNLLEVEKTQINFTEGGLILTSSQVINPSSVISSSGWSYAVVDCKEGDAFEISAMGQDAAAAAWTFIDANNNKILQSSQDDTDEVIYAPATASKLILNNKQGYWDRVSYAVGNKISFILNYLGKLGYQYMGVATPQTNPGTPTIKVYYIATTPGTYQYFNKDVVNGYIGILSFDPSTEIWSFFSIDYHSFNFAFTKFWISKGASSVDVSIGATSTTITISANVTVFDYRGGYRFIPAGTYVVANNKNFYLSESASEYIEPNLDIKGTGQNVYLFAEDYAVAGQRGYNTWVGSMFGGTFISPAFNQISNRADIDSIVNVLGLNNPQKINFTEGGLIQTQTEVINPTSITQSSAWAYAVVDCVEGDMFKFYGYGQGTVAAVWTFIDENNQKILQASQDDINEIIIAPAGSAKLVMNNKQGYWDRVSYKGLSVIQYLQFYVEQFAARYKDYAEGWIDFTVPVNQYIPDLTNTEDATHDNESSIENVNCILKLPKSYTNIGKPSRLLMICHGAGSMVSEWKASLQYNAIVTAFINAGYAVFDCDGYKSDYDGSNFWGAPRGIEGYYKAYQYVINNYNVEHDFSIYGFSMGGLTAVGLASRLKPNIKCIALGAPATDLQDAWEISSRHEVISKAYGFADMDTYEVDKTIGCDPTLAILSFNNTERFIRTLPPIRVWFGLSDTAVSPQAAQRLVTAIKNTNGIADFRGIIGRGHEICYGGDAAIIPEFVYWINRY